MPDKYELSGQSSQTQTDPKVEQWIRDYQIYDQDRQPFNPSKLILDGPESQSVESLDKNDFERAFFQTIAQGVALDENNQPHFFYPKTFLQDVDRTVFKPRTDKNPNFFKLFANGLNSIALFKNLPENKNNPTLQQEAKAAIDEYLDPELFITNFTHDDDLFEIFKLLNSDALEDQTVINCFNASSRRKQELDDLKKKKSIERAAKTDYRHIYEPTPNPESFKVRRDTTIEQILNKLKNSPNHAAFERINALKKWGDFIQSRFKDANYEEKIVSFGSNPHAHHRYSQYSNDNTYAVIAFDYAGRRCMIAESCGSGGAKSTSAAMKIWRSEPEDLDNKQGWMQAFTQSKTEASKQDLLQSISHTGMTNAINQRNSDNEDYIVEEEDRLFRLALHYFETGDLLGSGEEAVKKLGKFIGPKFRRPNPES